VQAFLMIGRFLLWSLADSATTVDELRAEELPASPGAVSETWFSDDATDRFGSFAVFADPDDATASVDRRLQELIGKAPDVLELFTLESGA
jgi:hypothetical protein